MQKPVEMAIRGVVEKGIELVAKFNKTRLVPPTGGHPFLKGIFQPMRDELTLTELNVTGKIPPELDGRYLRIGPNPVEPNPGSYHWFVGDGMVHGISIANGKAAWYRNRYIRSEKVARFLEVEAAPGPRHDFDTVNTNVLKIGERTFGLVEGGSYPVELGETLDQQTYNPLEGTLKGSFTAHPHRDPVTGDNHAMCYSGKEPSIVRHVVINSQGQVVREEPIEVSHGPMIHDCAFTDRYVVILDLPVTFSMPTLLKGYDLPYRWNPKHKARVGLLPKTGSSSDVIWCDVDPCFAFHVANAYDADDGSVVLDLCAYENMFGLGAPGPDGHSRGLERWKVDPKRRVVETQMLDGAPQDFPRIDERYSGRPHRYVYSMSLSSQTGGQFSAATALFAHDLKTGQRATHDFGPGRFPGEFVFVAKKEESPEGDGWLIGFVVDMNEQASELVIIDAQNFAGKAVARVHIPHRIPPGFHGNWIAR